MYCKVGWCDSRRVIVQHFWGTGGIMIDSCTDG